MIRGAIHAESAYAQGKMLDASGWAAILPRRITPSDIDHVFDDAGLMVFCEFSRQTDDWKSVSTGQYRLYRSLVLKGAGDYAAALCRHSVPCDRKIDTLLDVESFSLLYQCSGEVRASRAWPAEWWRHFIPAWFRGPAAVIRAIEKADLSHIVMVQGDLFQGLD